MFPQICGGEMPNKKLSTQYLNSNLPPGRYYDDISITFRKLLKGYAVKDTFAKKNITSS